MVSFSHSVTFCKPATAYIALTATSGFLSFGSLKDDGNAFIKMTVALLSQANNHLWRAPLLTESFLIQ